MPTVGRSATDNTNFNTNQGSQNQIGSKFTMPETGLIKTLHVFVAGTGGTITGQLVLWNSSGAILGQTGNITFASGSSSLNGQSFQVADLQTPVLVSSGSVIYIGFWRNPSSSASYSWKNSGGIISPSPSAGTANVASPGTLAIGSTATGQLSAYADYVKGGLGYSNGSSFTKYALKYWTGSAFNRYALKRWSGSTWEWFA